MVLKGMRNVEDSNVHDLMDRQETIVGDVDSVIHNTK